MAVSRTYTAEPSVLKGDIVTVEADLTRGLHSFTIVGLPGKAVEEAKDRVSAAIKNSGFKSPKSRNEKVVISLSPADLKKEGPLFDLPIAIAYLGAAGEIQNFNEKTLLIGELSLDGTLREVRGVLPAVIEGKRRGFKEVVVPYQNKDEAALIEGIKILPAKNLLGVIKHLNKESADHEPLSPAPLTKIVPSRRENQVTLDDVKGQETAKRGLIIAAAGRHNVVMAGPPGTGKTMLARAFAGLLPPLSREEALEVMSIHSLVGALTSGITAEPPFRSPHHTASHTALVGGGAHPRPGEVTLAHHGVLFMDEFPEFDRRSLDALRQPLEDRVVSISRVKGSAIFPADFVLLAALNPYRGVEDGTTNYSAAMMETYKEKISGPILDRIDLYLEVPHVPYETLTNTKKKTNETGEAIEKIVQAREKQAKRLESRGIRTNSGMSSRDIEEVIFLSDEVKELLKISAARLNLSPRSYHRLIKVSRTIADLEESEDIEESHVLEALQYRVKL
jgi:magnesium chelatase family protein